MATTPAGLPYPVGTDFVVDGDNAIRALAEAIGPTNVTPATIATPAIWEIGEPPLQFFKTAGMNALEGSFRNGGSGTFSAGLASGAPVTVVPAAFRPTRTLVVPALMTVASGSALTTAGLWLQSDGNAFITLSQGGSYAARQLQFYVNAAWRT